MCTCIKRLEFTTKICMKENNIDSIHAGFVKLLFDFINLTQVHNFTVSAQDIFTFRRLSVFTVSLTGILQVLMEMLKRYVPTY